MKGFKSKYIKVSDKYKYVSVMISGNDIVYLSYLRKIGKIRANSKFFKTEIEAARCVDMWLIRHGEDPVNVLKKQL